MSRPIGICLQQQQQHLRQQQQPRPVRCPCHQQAQCVGFLARRRLCDGGSGRLGATRALHRAGACSSSLLAPSSMRQYLSSNSGRAAPPRRTVAPQAARGGAAAAAAAAAAGAAQHEALAAQLFAASTLYAVSVAALMALSPRWSVTRRVVRSPAVLAPLALVYGLLLAWSWQPDTFSLVLPGSLAEGLKGGFNPQFMPSLPGICTLFSRWLTAASLWVHLLAVNLFAARDVYLQGDLEGVPTWHSILLCMTLAPLGLLSHAVTRFVARRR